MVGQGFALVSVSRVLSSYGGREDFCGIFLRYMQQAFVLQTYHKAWKFQKTNDILGRHHLDNIGTCSMAGYVHHPDSVRVAPYPPFKFSDTRW